MKKQIRVTLSGSGFRFPAHVGALAAIEAQGYEVVELSGTSGGSVVAALYAAGYSVSTLKDVMYGLDFRSLLKFTPSALTSFSYCNGKALHSFLESMLGKSLVFKDLTIPLHIVSSDIAGNVEHVFNADYDNVVIAVRASTAVPLLYSPVKLGKKWLVDGGICSNTPVELLKDDDVLKLGVRLTSSLDMTPINSAHKVLVRSANLLFDSNDRSHVDKERMEDAIFSFINTGNIGSFDTTMNLATRKELFRLGFDKTTKVLRRHQDKTFKKIKKHGSLINLWR